MAIKLSLNKTNGIPIYVQLEEQIRLLLHSGVLSSGDLMPTVRELAVQLGVNSNTVARVYHDLQREGLLELKRGVGTFVSRHFDMCLLSKRDVAVLETQVDELIKISRHMQLTTTELFQLIENRWQEDSDAQGK